MLLVWGSAGVRPERGQQVPLDVRLMLHVREQVRRQVLAPPASRPHQVARVNDEGTVVGLPAVDSHADVAAEGREYAHPVWDGVERGGDQGAICVRPRLVPCEHLSPAQVASIDGHVSFPSEAYVNQLHCQALAILPLRTRA